MADEKLFSILDTLEIEYKTLDHPVITTMAEGKDIMEQLEGNVCLNLFLKDKEGTYYIVVKRLGNRLDIKKLGKELNVTKLKLASPDEMTKLLYIPKGCATVFAICNDLSGSVKVLIDKELPKNEKVNFHPLRNNATTTISYQNMIKYINHYDKEIIYF